MDNNCKEKIDPVPYNSARKKSDPVVLDIQVDFLVGQVTFET